MKRHKFTIVALIVGILAPFASLVGSTQSAWAFTCSSNVRTWAAFHWTRTQNDISGVRAPIQMRQDGGLCDNNVGAGVNFSAVWIALEDNSTPPSGNINQAGLIHGELDQGGKLWCRFFAGGTGRNPVLYNCAFDLDADYVFFSIHPNAAGTKYQIEDCGKNSGGYGNCQSKYGNDPVYSKQVAATDAETPLGCDIHIMGSSGDPQNAGNGGIHVQGLVGPTWAARSWGNQGVYNLTGPNGSKQTSVCGTTDYQLSETNQGEIMKFWDVRNSQ